MGCTRGDVQGESPERGWSIEESSRLQIMSRDEAVMSKSDKRTQAWGVRALVLGGDWRDATPQSLSLTFCKVMRMPTPPSPSRPLHNRLPWGCLSEMDESEAGRKGGRENWLSLPLGSKWIIT